MSIRRRNAYFILDSWARQRVTGLLSGLGELPSIIAGWSRILYKAIRRIDQHGMLRAIAPSHGAN